MLYRAPDEVARERARAIDHLAQPLPPALLARIRERAAEEDGFVLMQFGEGLEVRNELRAASIDWDDAYLDDSWLELALAAGYRVLGARDPTGSSAGGAGLPEG